MEGRGCGQIARAGDRGAWVLLRGPWPRTGAAAAAVGTALFEPALWLCTVIVNLELMRLSLVECVQGLQIVCKVYLHRWLCASTAVQPRKLCRLFSFSVLVVKGCMTVHDVIIC